LIAVRRLLATIEDWALVETILAHLGLPVDLPQPSPARTPAWLPGVREAADHDDGAGNGHGARMGASRAGVPRIVQATGTAWFGADYDLTGDSQ
jgi:hypothetical protein